ncbi:PHP domain-containing protein [Thermaerobacter sp. PB12/4term]|uniref:PHP domain-containing protein n=1 Tax=Thermaerobacter sp. PB12/4term TaxID=2293838 RepID=UPI0027385E4E|nr:PHP domain-containing protein [Thermaerobacter sp. PB12/4term]
MTNKRVAALLEEIADLVEIDGTDARKAGAYRRAARTVSALRDDLRQYLEGDRLLSLPGIGPAIAAKIRDFYATGSTRLLDELRARVPAGVQALLAVPGLGPRTAARLFHELGIDSPAALREALEDGRVAALPGMGEARARKLREALDRLDREGRRLNLGEALAVATAVAEELGRQPGVAEALPVGAARRGVEQVEAAEVLVLAEEPAVAAAAVAAWLGPQGGTAGSSGGGDVPAGAGDQDIPAAAGGEGAPVGPDGDGTLRVLAGTTGEGWPVRVTVAPLAARAAALIYTTGSQAHWRQLRQRARQRGWELEPAGLRSPGGGREGTSGEEASLYRSLGLEPVPPELREGQGEVEAAAAGRLPRVVAVAQLRGDLHVHSRWSDGAASIAEMAAAARARGYLYLAICDHSRSLKVAHGLEIAELEAQWAEIDRLNGELAAAGVDFRILKGAEVDILKDGRLDYPDEILARLDVVVASVHTHLQLDRQAMTERLLAAAEHPHVDIIGHPTGRRLGFRDPYDADLEAVIAAAARYRTALEINASPERLDLPAVWARRAAEAGVWLVIDTDAHAPEQLEQVVLGIKVARRAWVEPGQVLNTLDRDALLAWLEAPKGRRPGPPGTAGA